MGYFSSFFDTTQVMESVTQGLYTMRKTNEFECVSNDIGKLVFFSYISGHLFRIDDIESIGILIFKK